MVDGAMCSRGTAVWHDRVAQRLLAGEHVVGRETAAAPVDAEAGRGVALRIEIDDQHVLADRGERGAEIDRGRGFADAALLVGDRQDARRPRDADARTGAAAPQTGSPQAYSGSGRSLMAADVPYSVTLRCLTARTGSR